MNVRPVVPSYVLVHVPAAPKHVKTPASMTTVTVYEYDGGAYRVVIGDHVLSGEHAPPKISRRYIKRSSPKALLAAIKAETNVDILDMLYSFVV